MICPQAPLRTEHYYNKTLGVYEQASVEDKFSLSHMLLVFSSAASVPVRLHIPMSPAMEMMDTSMEVKDDFSHLP